MATTLARGGSLLRPAYARALTRASGLRSGHEHSSAPLLSSRGLASTQTKSKKKYPDEKDGKTRFDITPFKVFECEAPDPVAYSDKDELLRYFRLMLRMRRMEIAADQLYKAGAIRGFCHLYDGQEAVGVGVEEVADYGDCLITAYRSHCQSLSRGSTVEEILSELTGRSKGVSHGKGGSMHMYQREHNYFGGNGIVGAQAPLGAGLGFALKYNDVDKVSLTMFGDGAANQGQIAEAINMAVLWRLPVVFICENNQYGMGTSTKRASAVKELYKREAYIPGMKMDGMDVLAVREGMKYSVEHAKTIGPIYVEMDTYRYHGHSMSDPGVTYRSRDEIKEIRDSRDPIDRVKIRLIDHKWSTMEDLKAIEKEVKKEIDEAAKAARTNEVPPEDSLYEHVYTRDDDVPARGTLLTNGNKVGWLSALS